MRFLWLFACAVLAVAIQTPAQAGEEVRYAPAPAWVQPVEVSPAKRSAEDAAVRTLLEDVQVRFGPDGTEKYFQTEWEVLTAEGLDDAGQVSRSWDPLTETMTIHAVEIIRDGKVINALGEGQTFTVIRQEPNLSYAVIDGRLTATLQLEDLRVGDIVRFASTRTEKDPTLADHIEFWDSLYHDGVIGRVRYRQVWPKDREVRWRATEGFAKPVLSQTALGTELISDARDVRMPIAPKGAPDRYNMLGELEVSSFKSWRELSALFAPYYAKAAVLKADSPLRAEAEKIRAANATKAAQASAALALVEQRVRYVALTMGVAGYQPAAADLTWSRRFGDCKGKSALLIALLTELGIQAEPVIVQTSNADGMDTRLPRAGLFDHVIVRAEIEGKSYWLDPTRSLDTDISRLVPPGYLWGLPLRAGGGDLEPIKQAPLTEPMSEVIMAIDARGGLTESAPATLTAIYRGEMALAMLRAMATVSHADAERNAREAWAKDMPSLTADKIKLEFQLEPDGSLRHQVEGRLKTPWATVAGAKEASFADTVFLDSFERRPSDAMDREAPFSLNFPYFNRAQVTMQLPREGKGFELVGADVDATVAGMNVRRRSAIKDGTATMLLDVKTVALETPYADAMAAEDRFKALPTAKPVIVRAPRGFTLTSAEADTILAERPKDAEAYIARAEAHLRAYQPTAALADLDQALAIEPVNTTAIVQKVNVLGQLGERDRALKMLDPLLAEPKSAVTGRVLRSQIFRSQERYAEALAELDQAISLAPNATQLLAMRAQVHMDMEDRPLALKDIDEALRVSPADPSLQRSKLWIEHGDDNRLQPWRDATIEYLNGRIKEEPRKAALYADRASMYAASRKTELALKDFDEAIRLGPSADHYLDRAQYLASIGRDAAALKDFSKAIALEPSGASYRSRASFYSSRRDFAAARKDLADGAKLDPESPLNEVNLAFVEVQSGEASAGFARLDKLALRDPNSPYIAAQKLQLHVAGKAYDLAMADLRLQETKAEGPAERREHKHMRAAILGEKGEAAESIKLYTELINDDPKDPSLLNGRCWSRAVAGIELAMAKADCEAAMALSSAEDQAGYLDSLGLVYLRLDRSADAVATYDKALTLAPRISTSLYGRGLAKARLGAVSAAEKDRAAALAIDPDTVTRFAGFGLGR